MPRAPRLDAPGCVHHVMLRGVERRIIFHDDLDRQDLLDRLSRVLAEARMPCFAWAFMPNHLHLVLRTGPVPLSRVMARVGTGYAQAFNRRHDRVGHLFQNRYRSILVEDDAQLLLLVRYVHRNPLQAGLVSSLRELERYPWTGHATLMGYECAPFQDARVVLNCFGSTETDARPRLMAWMSEERDLADEPAVSTSSPGFEDRSVPDTESADFAALVSEVCSAHGVLEGEVRSRSRTQAISRVRAEIVRRACGELGLSGARVARELGLSEAAVCQLRVQLPCA